jgi:hypothetical protein
LPPWHTARSRCHLGMRRQLGIRLVIVTAYRRRFDMRDGTY